MKEKKYHESTETICDQAKMNLDGNYFEPCHKITNEPERLLFLPYQCIDIRGLSTDLYCFPTQCETCKGRVFYQCLPCCPSSCSFSSSSLIFFFLKKLKSSKVLFRFTPPAPLAIILLKSRPWTTQSLIALTDLMLSQMQPIALTCVARTHFIVLFRQNNCFIASVPIWLPTNY